MTDNHPQIVWIFKSKLKTQQTAIFQVAVNNTDAIYLYFSQIEHCQSGMAMVVNPP